VRLSPTKKEKKGGGREKSRRKRRLGQFEKKIMQWSDHKIVTEGRREGAIGGVNAFTITKKGTRKREGPEQVNERSENEKQRGKNVTHNNE